MMALDIKNVLSFHCGVVSFYEIFTHVRTIMCWMRFLGFLYMVLPMSLSSLLCKKPKNRVQQHQQHLTLQL